MDPEKEFKKGQKAMSTGVFKWKSDLPQAAIHFENAAKAYETMRNYHGAVQAYEKLAQANEKMNDMWAAGRVYESLSILQLRNDHVKEAVENTEKAAELFRINGNSEKSLRMYIFMGTEALNKGLIELACRMFALALNLVNDDQLQMFARDVITPYVGLLIENRKYPDAMIVYEKELKFAQNLNRDHYMNKAAFCIVALTLLQNSSLCEGKFREMCSAVPPFIMSMEYQAITELLDAYEAGNQEDFDKAARKAVWNNVEVQLTRGIRNIKVPVAGQAVIDEDKELDFT